MLDHELRGVAASAPQGATEHLHVLIDDAHEGRDVDDTRETVAQSVVQGERQRCQRLASAGGDGQREHARRRAGLLAHMGQHLAPKTVHRAVGAGERVEAHFEPAGQLVERRVSAALPVRPSQPVVVRLGVQVVRVHARGEHHPGEKLKSERVGIPLGDAGLQEWVRKSDQSLPGRIRIAGTPKPILQSRPLALAGPVRHARMMARDAGSQYPADPAVAVDCDPGSRSGMVEPLRAAGEDVLELRGDLADVVQEAPGTSQPIKPEALQERGGAVGNALGVIRESVPPRSLRCTVAVGEVPPLPRCHPPSSRTVLDELASRRGRNSPRVVPEQAKDRASATIPHPPASSGPIA